MDKVSTMQAKFDFKDISIVPEVISNIQSRDVVNVRNETGKLPIIVSPMDTVVNGENYEGFIIAGFEVCTPRGIHTNDDRVFTSFSLDEFEEYLNYYEEAQNQDMQIKILVDIANGHMKRLYDLVEKFYTIRHSKNHILMIGNIANPKTYEVFAKLGVEYIRVGIGGGSACLTSANVGVHYPMASLIEECGQIKKTGGYDTKIVADGGFRSFDDIIKALMLGADYVMLGGILNKCLESCADTKLFKVIPLSKNKASYVWKKFPKLRKYFYKNFRGMSTKQVQKTWEKKRLRTSEGIVKVNKVDYTLMQWTNNFIDYLKSAMSYTNSLNLNEFKINHCWCCYSNCWWRCIFSCRTTSDINSSYLSSSHINNSFCC